MDVSMHPYVQYGDEQGMSTLHRRLSYREGPEEEPKTGFFQRGRELESVYDNHKYTDDEREVLKDYESLDYLPPHSTAYKHWLKRQPRRLEWDRWVMMGIIGFSVGFVGFLLHQAIDAISKYKWDRASELIQDRNLVYAWGFVMLLSVSLVFISTAIIVLCRPAAAASGLPELIGFLNGTVVKHIFNVKTFVAKFFSCLAAVASGLPIGPEGPMIHMGSLIGAGLSQMRSKTLGIRLPFFGRFRNSEDRRNFISAGAGAGIASAFGAPVGGLLFSMEEVSSFWNQKLTWQIFFCCMISTFTTDLFNSAFSGFTYVGEFGLFKTEQYILFEVVQGISVNILVFFPTIIIGLIGGVLGALFTFINVKIARVRRWLLSQVSSAVGKGIMKMGEPLIIIVIFVTVTVFLPKVFTCTPFECGSQKPQTSPRCLTDSLNPLHTEKTIYHYTCPKGVDHRVSEYSYNLSVLDCCNKSNQLCYTYSNGSFSQVATLMFTTGENAIKHLFSRQTQKEFSVGSLITVLVVYFFLSCWCAGTFIASGLVVPMLFIGALYGRIIGVVMVEAFGIYSATEEDRYWVWIDPGAFALIGAASFFGGVSRLTVSLTVIMVELTNDVQFLLPVMVTIMVAKWTGDFITHPIYHALLEMKCIPFLDAEPVIIRKDHNRSSSGVVNLELYCAENAMSSPAKVVHVHENVAILADLLLTTSHGGYPVVQQADNGTEVFAGLVSRHTIQILLTNTDLFRSRENLASEEKPEIVALDVRQLVFDVDGLVCISHEMLETYTHEPRFRTLFVDLSPYLNQSSPCVQTKFSLHRTYILFRTLGLRHLVVVDEMNRVAGVISRKDLMGFALEESLHSYEERQRRAQLVVERSETTDTSPVEMEEM